MNATALRTFVASAAFAAATAAHSSIIPDADTILYVNCDTGYKFGENLATAADRLTNLHRKNDVLATENPAGAFVLDGVSGAATANVGYFYSAGGPAATWQSNGYTAGDFTFEIFLRADSDASLSYLVNHTGDAWRLQWNGSKQLVFKKNWTALGTSAALNDGVWHHVAVVQDKTAGTLSYYVDYQLVSLSNETTELDSSSDQLIIGAFTRNGEYNYNLQSTKCAYDEVRLVKRALSPLEFLTTRAYPVDSDTVAYMSFDSTTAAKYDIDLGASRLGCDSRGRGSYSREVANNDKVSASLYPKARSSDSYEDDGVLLIDLGDGGNNAYSGAGYVFSDSNHHVGTKSFTVEVFTKFTRLPADYWGYIFFQRNMWSVFVDKQGKLAFDVTGKGTKFSAASLVGDNTWHHLAVVYDAPRGTYSFYLDYSLFHRFTDVAFDESAHNGKFAFGGNEDDTNNNWSMSGGVNGALYDELRITKRALSVAEFITPESVAGVDPVMHARFENNSWTATATGRYALAGEPSAFGVSFSSGAKPSREILDSTGTKILDDTCGAMFRGGTVAYPANGILDLDAGMAECFVKIEGGTATDSVICFAPANETATPIWCLNANGSYLVNTSRDSTSGNVAALDGQWHHFAVAWETNGGDTSVTVYFDHAAVANRTLSGKMDFGSGAGIVLGSAGFSGSIDELRIREGALDETSQLYFVPDATVILMR